MASEQAARRFGARMRGSALLLLALVLGGCYDGDPAVLREAVVAGRYQVEALDVRAATDIIETGTPLQLQALARTAGGAIVDITGEVTWTSTLPAALPVNGDGTVYGVTDGTAVISAQLGGISDSVVVTASSAALAGIVVRGTTTLDECRDSRYTALGDYEDGTRRDITALVGWQVDDAALGRFGTLAGETNRLYTRNAGTLGLFAVRAGIRSPRLMVTVADTLQSLRLQPGRIGELAEGERRRFSVVGNWGGADRDVSRAAAWSVRNDDPLADAVATVSNGDDPGLLETRNGGNARLLVRCGGLVDGADFSVVFLKSLAITNASPIELAPGDDVLLVLEGSYSDGSTRALNEDASWSAVASSGDVVQVSNVAGTRGLVTAGSAGISQVTAEVGSKQVTVSVTVADTP